MRAEITKRLIWEKNFTVVCIEGDWPDAYRVNRYVQGAEDDAEAVESLAGFKRFPTWMWRNAEVLDFVSWLREYNDRAPNLRRPKAGCMLRSTRLSRIWTKSIHRPPYEHAGDTNVSNVSGRIPKCTEWQPASIRLAARKYSSSCVRSSDKPLDMLSSTVASQPINISTQSRMRGWSPMQSATIA